MNEARDYTGWSIRYGFLAGNFNDEESEYASDYADAVKAALEERFPGAEVMVPFEQNASGSKPHSMKAAVYNENEEPEFGLEDEVDRIASEVYSSFAWLPQVHECLDCNQEVYDHESVPDVDDDSAWEKLAREHADDSEWIATRAHRREGQS